MTGETDLSKLLSTMSPELMPGEYVFCLLDIDYVNFLEMMPSLYPIAFFQEAEGITVVIERHVAVAHNLPFESVFKRITLMVHSSLDAVGLTAAVAKKLIENSISANVIAAYYHDHIFVQLEKADIAIKVLSEFQITR